MLITDGVLITWENPNRILEDHAILVRDGLIREVAPQPDMLRRYPQENRLSAHGQYVMPGNICAHTHFYGAFARGLPIPPPAPKDFPQNLKKLWWILDRSLTLESVRLSALVMLMDAIKHGTTTLVDHHASPSAIEGSLDILAQAVEQSGLRAVLCYEVTDRNGEAQSLAGIAENVRFIRRVREEHPAEGRISAMFGLHASLTLSDATLEACREALPAGVGFHVHVAEHEADEQDSLAKSGRRVVERLHQHGILGPHSVAVHAVHVDAHEIALLAESGTWVTHQPRSNMNNGVGVAPVEEMLRAGVRVCMGTDGFPHAMWTEWKFAYLLQKVWHRDPQRMSALDVIRMGVENNARLAEMCFPGETFGKLVPGAHADLIFVDYHPHTPLTEQNLPWHLIFGFEEGMVTTTIVAGKVLMHERQLTTLDEHAVTQEALSHSSRVWERYSQLSTPGI